MHLNAAIRFINVELPLVPLSIGFNRDVIFIVCNAMGQGSGKGQIYI